MIKYTASIAGHGYEWVNEYMREKPFHDPKPAKLVSFPQKDIEPLHIQFARLDEGSVFHSSSSYEAFLQFANNNGPLTHLATNWIELYEKSPYKDTFESSYHFWKDECYWLKLTREIFLATKETNIKILKEKLKPLIRLSEINIAHFPLETSIDLESSTQLLDAIRRIQSKQLTGSILRVSLLDNNLQHIKFYQIHHSNLPRNATIHHVIHALLGSIINQKMLQHKVTMSMNYYGEWIMSIHPESLIAYMWAALSEEVSGKTTYKQCGICGEWEDRSAPHSREDWTEHTNCGSRERMKLYRIGIAKKKKEEQTI